MMSDLSRALVPYEGPPFDNLPQINSTLTQRQSRRLLQRQRRNSCPSTRVLVGCITNYTNYPYRLVLSSIGTVVMDPNFPPNFNGFPQQQNPQGTFPNGYQPPPFQAQNAPQPVQQNYNTGSQSGHSQGAHSQHSQHSQHHLGSQQGHIPQRQIQGYDTFNGNNNRHQQSQTSPQNVAGGQSNSQYYAQENQQYPQPTQYFLGQTFNFVFQQHGTYDVSLNCAPVETAAYQQQQQQQPQAFGSQTNQYQQRPQQHPQYYQQQQQQNQPIYANYTPHGPTTSATAIRPTVTSPPPQGPGQAYLFSAIGSGSQYSIRRTNSYNSLSSETSPDELYFLSQPSAK